MQIAAWLSRIFTVAFFFTLCALGSGDLLFHLFPHHRLAGLQSASRLEPWSLRKWRKGTWQKKAENWALVNSALRSFSIPLMNEFSLRLFNQVSTGYENTIQLGNEDYFWTLDQLRPHMLQNGRLNRNAYPQLKKVERLSELLKNRGIPLVAVIEPSLIFQYPELIPRRYLTVDQAPYVGTTESFRLRGLPMPEYLIDVPRLLREHQASFPFRFFPSTGLHLNDIGACLSAKKIIERLQLFWGEDRASSIHCEAFELHAAPHEDERDLLKVANLLVPRRLERATPYLKPRAIGGNPSAKLHGRKLLLVGTSFFFGIEKILQREHPGNTTNFLFYYNKRRRNGVGLFRPLDWTKIDWSRLLDVDGVIIDASESAPDKLGFGFVEEATAFLERSQSDFP